MLVVLAVAALVAARPAAARRARAGQHDADGAEDVRHGERGADGYPGVGRVLVIIPTYNEADNIRLIVDRVRARGAGGRRPDRRRQQPGRHRRASPTSWPPPTAQIHVLHRPGKQGLGAAYLAGFAWARERGYDAVVEMDADGSHAPEELPQLLDALARRRRR